MDKPLHNALEKLTLTESSQSNDTAELLPFKKIDSSELALKSVEDEYGFFSTIFFGKYKGQPVAVKQFLDKKSRPGLRKNDTDPTIEGKIHHLAQHDYVVKLYGYVQDSAYNGLVMEHCTMGTIFDFLNTTTVDATKTERERYINQNAQALAYIHHVCNIIHRDIKPENILRIVKNGETITQVTDFGLSVLLEKGEKEHVDTLIAGSPNYIAPECIRPNGVKRSITFKADMFSFGVLLKAYVASPHIQIFPDTDDPVEAVDFNLLGGHEKKLPPDNTHTTATFHTMLTSLLRTDPNLRLSSKDFVVALNSGTRVYKHG